MGVANMASIILKHVHNIKQVINKQIVYFWIRIAYRQL